MLKVGGEKEASEDSCQRRLQRGTVKRLEGRRGLGGDSWKYISGEGHAVFQSLFE